MYEAKRDFDENGGGQITYSERSKEYRYDHVDGLAGGGLYAQSNRLASFASVSGTSRRSPDNQATRVARAPAIAGAGVTVLRSAMQWVYRAAENNTDVALTTLIAKNGFLCRSPQDRSGSARDARVGKVAPGDTIHFYCVHRGGKVDFRGTFEVVEPAKHERPDYFGDAVEGTALFSVVHPDLTRWLTQARWVADGAFTGWPVKLVGTKTTPHYDREKLFPGPGSLFEYPYARAE